MNDYDRGRWDVLYDVSCDYFGKQYYFIENDGRIYSRYSCKHMTLDGAIDEFRSRIYWDGE